MLAYLERRLAEEQPPKIKITTAGHRHDGELLSYDSLGIVAKLGPSTFAFPWTSVYRLEFIE